MSDKQPPRIENAPGLKWRERKTGWMAFWQARTDLAKRGFKPATVPLWRGIEPSEIDAAYISDQCTRIQDEMLVWGRGGIPQIGIYDGTIRSLAHCYQTDPDSSFRNNRWKTRENYKVLMKRIVRDHGDERIADLGGRDMLRWHGAWVPSGIPMAHSLMRMLRGMLSFGMTLLECEHCIRLSTVLSKQRFKMGKSRDQHLTAEQASAVRAKAHEGKFPSIALAQAFQFEGTMRQKDVIGGWEPLEEPGISEITFDGKKWLRGIRWEEIDQHLILRHVTSKKQKPIEVNLLDAPMVLEELKIAFGFDTALHDRSMLPATGPIIVCESTKRPWGDDYFRQNWRALARLVGIPDKVKNMDTRAGAITEATDSGATLEDTRHAAAHSNIATTEKYSRGGAKKAAKVLRQRVAFRQNNSGT